MGLSRLLTKDRFCAKIYFFIFLTYELFKNNIDKQHKAQEQCHTGGIQLYKVKY